LPSTSKLSSSLSLSRLPGLFISLHLSYGLHNFLSPLACINVCPVSILLHIVTTTM
jgi:hypothetical protein